MVIYRIVNIGLVISSLTLLGYVSFQAWFLLSDNVEPSTGDESLVSSVHYLRADASAYQIPHILNARLFGSPEKAKPVIVQTVVPKTRLSLKLHGTVGSLDPLLARALISSGGKMPRSYGVGENIPNTDVSIGGIEKARVLLDRKGNIESLALDRKAVVEIAQ